MLTPRFTCSQDEEYVYINIQISHIRFDAVGVQMIVENELFIFSLSPYYLRLRFSNPLLDDEEHPGTANYESKEEQIKIKLYKLNKGEVFSDLDLPAKLLARSGETEQQQQQQSEPLDTKQLLQEIGVQTQDEGLIKEVTADLQQKTNRPLIEVLGEDKSDLQKTMEEGEAFDWEINQQIESDNALKTKYGFNNQYDSIVGVSISNGNDINDLDDPEHTHPNDRIKERLLKENFKFDPEYYAADYMTTKYAQDDEYSEIKDLLKWDNPLLSQETFEFTKEENDKMLDLPKKKYIISNPKPLYYTIISLLFSYSYEMRETEGDLNTESAWTIGKLTPQLSSLDSQIILPDVTSVSILKAIIVTSIRRSLAYPLHRNFELSYKAWIDTVKILSKGKNFVLKSLLTLHEPFRFHDVYYVYNKVIIDDLISWLIHDSKDNDFILKSLGQELQRNLNSLEKDEIVFETLDEQGDVDTYLNILEIEQIAEEMYKNDQEQK